MEQPTVDMFVRTVASNVRALRMQADMTLADVAAAAGLGKSTLAQLESGKANPSVETLWAICAALQVPFARIVEEERPSLRVVVGRLRVGPQGEEVELGPGDLVTFVADVPHVYEAVETTHAVLLMSYP